MITVQSGKLIIPENERFVGFAGDDRAAVKTILLPEDYSDQGCTYTLFLKFDDDRVTSVPLTVSTEEEGLTAVWLVRKEHILRYGIIMAQLRVNCTDGTVAHTGCDYFVAGAAAEVDEEGAEIDILNRTEFEERMAETIRQARAIAPYIGDDGYWYIYSCNDEAYVRSFYALGPIIDSELSGASTNPVQNRVVKSALDAKADKTQTIAGLSLSGNISRDDLVNSIIGKINPPLVVPGTTAGHAGQYGRTVSGSKPVYCSGLDEWVELATADATMLLANPEHAVPANSAQTAPDYTASDFTDLNIGQLFLCQLSPGGGNVISTYWIKAGVSSAWRVAAFSDIPTATSALTNDSGFLTAHQDVSGKENTSNKVTSLSSASTDSQYPSAKCVYDLIGDVESLLSQV